MKNAHLAVGVGFGGHGRSGPPPSWFDRLTMRVTRRDFGECLRKSLTVAPKMRDLVCGPSDALTWGMIIEAADVRFPGEAGACDFSFEVNAEALPPFDGPTITAIGALAPHRKSYDLGLPDYRLHTGTDDRALLTVRDGSRFCGYIALSRKWNSLASIDDIAVDASARRTGAARKLIAASIDWARLKGLRGVTAETQTNNVAACRLYESCGFSLGGFDRHLYAAIDQHRHETALFWYLIFPPGLRDSEQT